VLGVTLMLMGENSRTVTNAVKARIEELLPSLPEGTRIEPFYDRSKLVDRTVRTVAKNLVEGAALVIATLFSLCWEICAPASWWPPPFRCRCSSRSPDERVRHVGI